LKTILITGATSGIGEALALHAVNEGYKVIACGRNAEKLKTLSLIENITPLQFDVSDEQQCMQALSSIRADIFVLNAGTCEYVDVDKFDPAMFDRVFQANFMGVVNCIAGILPSIKSGNQIVLVDSLARLMPFTRSQAYGSSKAALYYFGKSLDVDLSQKNILVQTVSPGFIETPLTDKNDFEMPMKISAKEGVKVLLKGIAKRKKTIYFPYLLALLMRCLSLLPINIQISICRRMKL
jgi:NAD(P)-dependent dehydrogenase (short-subunit alcohol dehydrogenase family)